ESQYKINVFDRNVPINKETIKSKEETFAKPSVINRYNKVKSSDDIKSAEHTTKPDNNINQPVYNVGRQSSAEKPVFNDNIFVSGSGIKSDNINISNTQGADNYSARTPGILTSPPLDATDLLKKGEFYIIRFHGVIDGGGFLKELTVIKTSGFLRLDTIAKQHIMNNWRWTPGFDNAEVAIELRVEKKI
ncbi:MAG TPA: hypothetical protein PLJ38_06145, partial [bacterium]|nr:hypothetical protein [bacterium]